MKRKLTLRTETLRTLTPGPLRAVIGGTVLVNPPDPVTGPKTDRTGGGPAAPSAYSCGCIG